jgi:hypothetical protein
MMAGEIRHIDRIVGRDVTPDKDFAALMQRLQRGGQALSWRSCQSRRIAMISRRRT